MSSSVKRANRIHREKQERIEERTAKDSVQRPSSGFCLIIIKRHYAKVNEIVAAVAAAAGKDCGLQ